MSRLSKQSTILLEELCTTEKIKAKSVKNSSQWGIKVVAKDKREYLVFSNVKQANTYAEEIIVKNEDDPTCLKQLGWLGKTIEQYANELVSDQGAHSVLSYDTHHKVNLSKSAVAYRIL